MVVDYAWLTLYHVRDTGTHGLRGATPTRRRNNMNNINCGYYSRAALIFLSWRYVRLLFEGGYYSMCGYYSSKYGIYRYIYIRPSVFLMRMREKLFEGGHPSIYQACSTLLNCNVYKRIFGSEERSLPCKSASQRQALGSRLGNAVRPFREKLY